MIRCTSSKGYYLQDGVTTKIYRSKKDRSREDAAVIVTTTKLGSTSETSIRYLDRGPCSVNYTSDFLVLHDLIVKKCLENLPEKYTSMSEIVRQIPDEDFSETNIRGYF